MIKAGIDVSSHNGAINWEKVKKAGTDFAILRAGYGKYASQKDARFEENYRGCRDIDIPVGVYHYSYAVTAKEAAEEGRVCLDILGGRRLEYPVYFDIEESAQYALGTEVCSEMAAAFCDVIEKGGYWAGIYSYKNFLESRLSAQTRKRYAVWLAHTGVTDTDYDGAFGIWQYSHSGKVNGVTGAVDLDRCYTDYPSLMKKAGLGGYGKEGEKYTEYTVRNGDTLWGIASRFLGSGTRYTEIKALNKLKSVIIYAGQVLKIPEK